MFQYFCYLVQQLKKYVINIICSIRIYHTLLLKIAREIWSDQFSMYVQDLNKNVGCQNLEKNLFLNTMGGMNLIKIDTRDHLFAFWSILRTKHNWNSEQKLIGTKKTLTILHKQFFKRNSIGCEYSLSYTRYFKEIYNPI
jgi:hypothetical protein